METEPPRPARGRPYGALTPQERERAWREALAEGGPLAAPLGFHAHVEQEEPAPPYRPTPKRLRKQRRVW